MKKLLLFAGLVAATLSFVGCNKQEVDVPGLDGKKVEIILTDAQTRTVNDGLSTKWVDDDKLSVFYAPAGTTEWSANTPFTVTDATNNKATGEVELTEASYDWYLFYPYTKQIPNPTTLNPEGSQYERSGYTPIGSKSNATQTQVGLNSTEHLKGSNLPVWGVAKNVAADKVPTVAMKHVASVVKVNVTNGLKKAIAISSLSFTGTEDIVGTYYIDFSGDAPTFVGSGEGYISSTANLTVSNADALAAGATASFYIAVKPFTAPANGELGIKVVADAGSVEKTVKLDKKTEFQAGHIKTLNVTFAQAEELPTLTLADIKDLVKGATSSSNAVSFEGKLAGAIVTFVSGRYAFIQDETAGLVFYNNTNPFEAGQKLEGVVSGSGYAFNGLKEVTSLSVETITPGQTVPAPVELSLAELDADYDRYESVRVTVKNATVSSAFSSRNTTMTDGDVSLTLRDQKNGLTISAGVYDITGYPSYYNAKQFGVWTQDDIVPVASEQNFFGVSQNNFNVSATTTSVSVNVTGNVDWTAVPGDDVTVDPASGTGEGTVTVTFPANTDTKNTKEYAVHFMTEASGVDDDDLEVIITQAKADATGVTTVSTTMEAYAKAHECTISEGQTVVNYKELQLDDVVTMSTSGEGNCGSFWYATGTQWRLYQNKSGNVVISLASGYKLKSVSFVYDGYNTGTLKDPQGTIVASGDVYETDASSVEFTVGNTASATNGQVRITEVTIKYEQGQGTTPTPVDPTIEVPSTLSVVKGETAAIEVTTNSNGARTWTSSDETVATVDNNGVVTGVKAGSATITLSIAATSAYNAGDAQVAVNVTEPVTGGNTVSMTMSEYVEEHGCTVSGGTDATMYKTLQLSASVRMSTTGADNCGSFWNTSASNDTKQWRLYQKQNGNVIITVADGCELVSVKITYANNNNGVLLDASGSQVASGTTQTVSGSSVTYTVGNTSTADNGQVRITAVEIVYTGDGTTFPEEPPTVITTTISIPGSQVVYIGESFSLNATSNVEGATFTYESEDPNIASVNASGVVTGVAEGSVKVYARIAGVEGEYTDAEKYCNVTVSKKPDVVGGTWEAKSLSSIADGTQFILVSTNAEGESYAMSNNNGTAKAPSAVAVTVTSNTITNPASNVIFVLKKTSDGYIFSLEGGESWVYTTASNNGIRVGTEETNVFTVDAESSYLTISDGTATRYLGVYNKQDWRAYTSVNNNIKEQTFTFFVKK